MSSIPYYRSDCHCTLSSADSGGGCVVYGKRQVVPFGRIDSLCLADRILYTRIGDGKH